MPSASGAHIKYVWRQQADAAINQANPVSAALYPVLAATEDVRILSIMAQVIWTVQPSPLEIVMTIDGIPFTYIVANPVSGTSYYATERGDDVPANQILSPTLYHAYKAFLIEGQNIGVQARTTGGTVQNLICRVKWARLLPT